AERDINVVQLLLSTAHTAVDMYSAPERREVARLEWAGGLLPLLENAEPGSDQQLALARSFAAAAVTPEQGAYLIGLLDGSRALPGLAIDTDLRWQLVQNLARRGIFGEDEIGGELERDATIK